MFDQLVEFLERTLVEEDLHAFARGEPAFAMLTLTTFSPAAFFGAADFVPEDGDSVGHVSWAC